MSPVVGGKLKNQLILLIYSIVTQVQQANFNNSVRDQ